MYKQKTLPKKYLVLQILQVFTGITGGEGQEIDE